MQTDSHRQERVRAGRTGVTVPQQWLLFSFREHPYACGARRVRDVDAREATCESKGSRAFCGGPCANELWGSSDLKPAACARLSTSDWLHACVCVCALVGLGSAVAVRRWARYAGVTWPPNSWDSWETWRPSLAHNPFEPRPRHTRNLPPSAYACIKAHNRRKTYALTPRGWPDQQRRPSWRCWRCC